MNNEDTTLTQTNTDANSSYENNPLFVATKGIDLLFKKALSVGILFAILSALSVLGGVPSSFTSPATDQPAAPAPGTAEYADSGSNNFLNAISNVSIEMWLFIALIVLVVLGLVIFVATIFQGVTDVTSSKLSRGESITFTDAFKEVFSNIWGYLWVLIVMNVKIFLWTLLLIIPGIIMAVRYSLSGVVYFDKKLKGNASVKESSRVVKGAWLTTFASQNLLNMLTLGFIAPLLTPGTNAVLYRQLSPLTDTKPKAHIVSWLTLIIPILLGSLLLLLLIWASSNFINSFPQA